MSDPGKRDDRGTALVELALLLPVILTIFFGIIEMGLLFNAWVSVQHAAALGARYAVTGRTTCPSGGSGRTGCIVSEALTGVAHLKGPKTVTVTSWAYPDYTVAVSDSAGQQCDAVEVRVQYTYRTMLPLISAIFSTIDLTGRQRFLNEPYGPCHQT